MSKEENVETVHKVLRGWFKKKGGKTFSKARKRWFVMDDQTITYYEKQDEKICKGDIFVPAIKEVKTNKKNLTLVTDFRSFVLTGEAPQVVEWANGIEQRLKDSKTVGKLVEKTKEVMMRSVEVEKHTKDLCEYIEILEHENKGLRDEVGRLTKENKSFREQLTNQKEN